MKRFTQSAFWAEFKSQHGWKSCPVTVDGISYSVLVRQLSLKFKKISIAYIPMAPEVAMDCPEVQLADKLSLIAEQIKKRANSMDYSDTQNHLLDIISLFE